MDSRLRRHDHTTKHNHFLDRIERTASDAWVCGVPIQPFWPPYRCGARSGGGGAHATAAQAPAGRNGSMGHRCPCVSPACECDVALARMSPEATGFLIETLRLSTVPGTSSRLRLRWADGMGMEGFFFSCLFVWAIEDDRAWSHILIVVLLSRLVCWLGETEPRGDIQKNKLWKESGVWRSWELISGCRSTSDLQARRRTICSLPPKRMSLPANGSYLQCSVRLRKQLEYGTNMATHANYDLFFNPKTLIDVCMHVYVQRKKVSNQNLPFRFRATNVTALTSDHPLLVSAAHHNGHNHGKELGRELPSHALGRISRSLLDHQRLYHACRRWLASCKMQ